jgi:hypothetical protein
MKLIAALNALSTPWLALLVIVLGAAFYLVCGLWHLSTEPAVGIIGGGVGLLTGQVINHASNQNPTHPQPVPNQ